MSLREVPSSRPLLARKGAAEPANPRTVKADPAQSPPRSIEDVGEIAPGSAAPDLLAGLTTGAAGVRGSDSAPAASLLPFNLLRQRYRPEVSPDLVADEPDLASGGQDESRPADAQADVAAALPANLVATAPALAAARDMAPDGLIGPRLEPRISTPASARPAPPAPKPDPDWRVGATMAAPAPALDPARTSRGGWLLPFAALAVAFAILAVGWRTANPDVDLDSLWQPIVAAISPTPSKTETAGATERATPTPTAPVPTAPPAPVVTGTAPTPPAPANASPAVAQTPQGQDTAMTPPASTPSDPPATVSVAVPPQPLQTKLPAPTFTAPETAAKNGGTDSAGVPDPAKASAAAPSNAPVAPAQAAPAAKESPSAPTPAATAATKPTVDVVRLEANGEAVIAGRAAPNSELIVLDNGKPIGSVKADAFGEWVFVPEAALPAGEHEFGLVLKTVEETVSLPAPSKPSLPPAPDPEPTAVAPATGPADAAPDPQNSQTPDAPSAAGQSGAAIAPAPIPVRKPSSDGARAATATEPQVAVQTPSGEAADFVVQLASVKTRSGAEQEWRKLQQRFPEILADMIPALDEVKLADFGTVVRVRTGAFNSQQDAANLCARLTAQSQDCLVVRVSAGN